MNRSRFLFLLGTSPAIATAADRSPSEVAEDEEICSAASHLMELFEAADFEAVAGLMHPLALQLVFDSLSTGFEKLVERFGEEKTLAASGLSAHPRKLGLTPAQFFVHSLDLLEARYPGVTAVPPERQLKILGGILDSQGKSTYAHILYDYRGTLKSNSSETKYVKPQSLTLIKGGTAWQCWSAIGGNLLMGHWYSALKPKSSQQPANEEQ